MFMKWYLCKLTSNENWFAWELLKSFVFSVVVKYYIAYDELSLKLGTEKEINVFKRKENEDSTGYMDTRNIGRAWSKTTAMKR